MARQVRNSMHKQHFTEDDQEYPNQDQLVQHKSYESNSRGRGHKHINQDRKRPPGRGRGRGGQQQNYSLKEYTDYNQGRPKLQAPSSQAHNKGKSSQHWQPKSKTTHVQKQNTTPQKKNQTKILAKVNPQHNLQVIVSGITTEDQLDQIRIKLETLNFSHQGNIDEHTGFLFLTFKTEKAAQLSTQVINFLDDDDEDTEAPVVKRAQASSHLSSNTSQQQKQTTEDSSNSHHSFNSQPQIVTPQGVKSQMATAVKFSSAPDAEVMPLYAGQQFQKTSVTELEGIVQQQQIELRKQQQMTQQLASMINQNKPPLNQALLMQPLNQDTYRTPQMSSSFKEQEDCDPQMALAQHIHSCEQNLNMPCLEPVFLRQVNEASQNLNQQQKLNQISMKTLGEDQKDFERRFKLLTLTDRPPPTSNHLNIINILSGKEMHTTVMICNIPIRFSQIDMLALINKHNFGTYDYYYQPMDLRTNCNRGFAYINFTHPYYIVSFYMEFQQLQWNKVVSQCNSNKRSLLFYANVQGKFANIQSLADKNVMYKPEEMYKPVIIDDQTLLAKGCLACLGTHFIKRIWEDTDLQNRLLRNSTDFKGLAPVIQLIKQQKYVENGNQFYYKQHARQGQVQAEAAAQRLTNTFQALSSKSLGQQPVPPPFQPVFVHEGQTYSSHLDSLRSKVNPSMPMQSPFPPAVQEGQEEPVEQDEPTIFWHSMTKSLDQVPQDHSQKEEQK